MNLCGRKWCVLLILNFSFLPFGLIAQSVIADSLIYQQAISNTISTYQQMVSDQSRLFNGLQYAGYPFAFLNGHQFYDTAQFTPGTIVYDNTYYPLVQLQYDEISDVVIIQENQRRIQLSSERVSGFTLLNKNFRKLTTDSVSKLPAGKDGFYILLYDGAVSAFKKETKEILDELTSDQGVLHRIIVKQSYLIKKGNEYVPVTSKRDLLAVFKDRKKEVREFQNRLNFRKNKEDVITRVSAYYDQITRPN
jgi:hypothetical protein